jgi:hypothetical protein
LIASEAEMNAASGSQPARGVIVAPLVESHPDRIVVGSCTLFLRDGKRCTYAVGTSLEVAYTEVHLLNVLLVPGEGLLDFGPRWRP